jgi:cytochrome c biogenesis factor
VLTIIFALATYTALNIQTHIGDSPIFNQTLGLGSPLIIGGDNFYMNLTAIITNAVLIVTAYLVLAKDKPRTGLVRYSLGIIAVYAILSAALYLAIIANPAHACTPLPTNLDSMAIFMASIVIGSVTPLVYAHEKRWRVGSDWKPLLFTLYASIIAGSLIIDTTTALALHSMPQPAPACIGSVTIGAYGPIDGLITAPLLGLLAGYIVLDPIRTDGFACSI